MKQHRRPPRRNGHGSSGNNGNGNGNGNGNRNKDQKNKRPNPQSQHATQFADEIYESAIAPQSPGELEAYLSNQMRFLIHARQEQERALRQIRALGEQLTQDDASASTREQYSQAVALWQSSRRNGVSARQKLLFAMSEKLMIDHR